MKPRNSLNGNHLPPSFVEDLVRGFRGVVTTRACQCTTEHLLFAGITFSFDFLAFSSIFHGLPLSCYCLFLDLYGLFIDFSLSGIDGTKALAISPFIADLEGGSEAIAG